ncbi:MAG: N-acetyltransferase [Deltaproteobacteria bacterium]|nr:MAG: N-acetyltransferase [Deltaproteobacteria bacterium]TNF31883.1 MAG: N-acetyltransferase [Deltaproteobacteria bacterium]
MAIKLREVDLSKKKEVKEFAFLPWKIYKNDPTWVPPLRLALLEMLDQKNHPFYQTGEVKCWIAELNGEVAGRIMGVDNKAYNEYHNDKTGFFGFFECVQNDEVAIALINQVETWLKSKGKDKVVGPVNPSTNYECGLLVKGYDDPPQLMMTYNPKYYEHYFEDMKYAKAKDLLAYQFEMAKGMPEKIVRIAERVQKSKKITYREISTKHWDRDIKILQDIYNDAWEKNWGFVPMTPDEFAHTAKDMKQIVDSRLIIIAEVDGEAAGFIVALPDYNQVFKKIPDGKLLPTGIFKLLFGKKGIKRMRVITLGTKQKFRKMGIETVLYHRCWENAFNSGIEECEMSWVLEDNLEMNKPIIAMGGVPYKTYRILEKGL